MFSPMRSFTGCPKTSFTLPCERSEHGRLSEDALEDDGRTRTTGAVCGGGASPREVHGRAVPRVRHLASSGVRVAAALRGRRSGSHRGAQPASAHQPAAQRRSDAAASDRVAAALSRLGCAQAAGAAGRARGRGGAQHDSSHLAAAWVGAPRRPAPAGDAALRAQPTERAVADGRTSRVRSCGIRQ